jgi:phospholipid/cholesterol/gamma-HCH transport system substrate-binding protein
MEIRASYLLVGLVVLALVAGLAAFSVWLVRSDVDRQVQRYEIMFPGSVSGLQEGSQVRYRGIPVGRVADIRIDPDNVEAVLVEAEIERGTPIRQDTEAMLEMQGITGIAYVQLRGGSQASPSLEPGTDGALPRITGRRSALERVFESTPELLARALAVLERASLLFEDQNLEALAGTLRNVETLTGTLASHSDSIETLLTDAAGAATQVESVSNELGRLATDLRGLTAKLDRQVDGVGGDLIETLAELQTAASALGQAAGQLDGLVGELRVPLDDFAGTGLYEFTQLVGETRLLIAALTRITKEFERDPAGFLIGRSRGGFQAE